MLNMPRVLNVAHTKGLPHITITSSFPLPSKPPGPPFPSPHNKPSIHQHELWLHYLFCVTDHQHRHPHGHFSSLHMFCALYRTILQHLLPLFLYMPMPIIECFHNFGFFSSAIVVDQLQQYNCCRCFYNTLSRCMHCQIQMSYIACSLLIKITCY